MKLREMTAEFNQERKAWSEHVRGMVQYHRNLYDDAYSRVQDTGYSHMWLFDLPQNYFKNVVFCDPQDYTYSYINDPTLWDLGDNSVFEDIQENDPDRLEEWENPCYRELNHLHYHNRRLDTLERLLHVRGSHDMEKWVLDCKGWFDFHKQHNHRLDESLEGRWFLKLIDMAKRIIIGREYNVSEPQSQVDLLWKLSRG